MSKQQQEIPEGFPALVSPIKSDLVQIEFKSVSILGGFPFKTLAAGTYGAIALGKMNGEEYAIKTFSLSCTKEEITRFQKGMSNVLEISSNKLAKPAFDYYKQYTYTRESEQKWAYAQVMPYIKGKDLQGYLRDNKNIAPEKRNKIALQIAQGLSDLHKHKLVHCDFKLKNILIEDSTLNIYICDFDFTLAEDKEKHSFDDSEMLYDDISPPEHLRAHEEELAHQFTSATDIYRLGCVLYALYTQDLVSGNKIKESALSADEFSNLIRKCVDVNPEKRPSAAEIVECLEKICSQSETLATSSELAAEKPEYLQPPGSEPEVSFEETSKPRPSSGMISCLSTFSFIVEQGKKAAGKAVDMLNIQLESHLKMD